MTVLTPEDSKRVADALIAKIAETDIQKAVQDSLTGFLVPKRGNWHSDWFPLVVEDMCVRVVNIFDSVAQEFLRRKTK